MGTIENVTPAVTTKTRMQQQQELLKYRMKQVKHTVAVISGKGGVGKSTVTVNLAASFAIQGKQIGVLDADIHGPSVPRMLSLTGQQVKV